MGQQLAGQRQPPEGATHGSDEINPDNAPPGSCRASVGPLSLWRAQTVVPGTRSDPDYARYRTILADVLILPIDDQGAPMIGSPNLANLVEVLDKLTRALPPYQLPKARTHVAVRRPCARPLQPSSRAPAPRSFR